MIDALNLKVKKTEDLENTIGQLQKQINKNDSDRATLRGSLSNANKTLKE